ncbi:cobyrinic acid a,c-diamide synthase [Salinisphaera sp. T31B1]|uniref:cobyrinic acid a,c-diamide synthase n=1 Tax=Salinisphaera sp. T31B1 TaxID=727963 RepID=UPI003341517E
MFEFLQGFAYGLFLSCLPWFVVGMVEPRLAVPTEPPSRWQAILRYWFVVPFVAFLLWLTSLWGGFGPSLLGWIAGLAGLAVEIPVERRWRGWRARRLARRRAAVDAREARRAHDAAANAQREKGVTVLDPAAPPADADDVVRALCAAKKALLDAQRPELATQADRLYARYIRVLEVLGAKFDQRELTFDRSRSLAAQVCLTAVDNLNVMSSLAAGVQGIDTAFVRHRLQNSSERLHADERDALQQRLDLAADTERRLSELGARNETAMTTLDNAAVVMARVATGRPQASVAADEAVADLKRFMDKADRYAHKA